MSIPPSFHRVSNRRLPISPSFVVVVCVDMDDWCCYDSNCKDGEFRLIRWRRDLTRRTSLKEKKTKGGEKELEGGHDEEEED